MLEEDEAELELQKQLEKGRACGRQLQQLRDSGEKVRGPGLGAGGLGLRDRCVCSHLARGTRVPRHRRSPCSGLHPLCVPRCYWWVSRFLPCFHWDALASLVCIFFPSGCVLPRYE